MGEPCRSALMLPRCRHLQTGAKEGNLLLHLCPNISAHSQMGICGSELLCAYWGDVGSMQPAAAWLLTPHSGCAKVFTTTACTRKHGVHLGRGRPLKNLMVRQGCREAEAQQSCTVPTDGGSGWVRDTGRRARGGGCPSEGHLEDCLT